MTELLLPLLYSYFSQQRRSFLHLCLFIVTGYPEGKQTSNIIVNMLIRYLHQFKRIYNIFSLHFHSQSWHKRNKPSIVPLVCLWMASSLCMGSCMKFFENYSLISNAFCLFTLPSTATQQSTSHLYVFTEYIIHSY